MRVLPGPTKSNQVLRWSPDGRLVLAGGTGDGIMVWDVDAGTPGTRILKTGHNGRLMRFCPRTGRLYVAFQAGGFWRWAPETGEEKHQGLSNNHMPIHYFALSADGRRAVVVRPRERNSAVFCYDVADDGKMTEVWARADVDWADTPSFAARPGTNELFGVGR